jgi:hypothetical protein
MKLCVTIEEHEQEMYSIADRKDTRVLVKKKLMELVSAEIGTPT